MFNEILTGKASLENKPQPDPYREQTVPDVSVTCTQCAKSFKVKAGSHATTCMDCQLKNAAIDGAQYGQTYNSGASNDAAWQVVKVFLYIGVAILLAVVRYNIRHG